VIDNRYSGKRPTILMSNQSIKGIAGYIGERAFDRLKETSTLVKFDWPSYRPTARGEQ
jgi:DNA replication protein DnaC